MRFFRRLSVTFMVMLSAVLLVPAVAHAAGPWPVFGHDAQHSRRSPVRGSQTGTLKWATTTCKAAVSKWETVTINQ